MAIKIVAFKVFNYEYEEYDFILLRGFLNGLKLLKLFEIRQSWNQNCVFLSKYALKLIID